MPSTISFLLGRKPVTIDFCGSAAWSPAWTLLQYLRSLPDRKGTKEGCGQGDCGACTVVLAEPDREGRLKYSAVNSCLLFLPMVHGRQVLTVEDLKFPDGSLHPVQQAMIDHYGSQCGFCTPGVVMTLFALFKQKPHASAAEIRSALAGNLCRCTGYQPIFRAAQQCLALSGPERESSEEGSTLAELNSIPPAEWEWTGKSEIYCRPKSLEQALEMIGRNPTLSPVHGATDLSLQVHLKHNPPPGILDLSAIPELRASRQEKEELILGSGMSLSDVAGHVRRTHPALEEMLQRFGSAQIRNVATLGGNVGTASPIGDALPALMAYGAAVELKSLAGSRTVPLSDFILGYRRTGIAPGEIIAAVRLPFPAAGAQIRAYKVSRRHDVDISTVNAAFRLQLDSDGRVCEAQLVFGGMSPFTRRAAGAEQALLGKEWSRAAAEEAAARLQEDFQPISDVRGSAGFRRQVAANLLLKFWSDTRSGQAP